MTRLAMVLAVCAGAAQAEELVIDQTGFTAIHVNEDVTVNITYGDEYSVVARTVDGDLSKLDVNRYSGWLVFNRDTRWFIFPNGRTDEFIVDITTPVLNEVKSFDGSRVFVTGLTADALRAEAATGGTLTLLDASVDDLALVVNDGSIAADGTCETVALTGTAGFVDASALACATGTAPPQDVIQSMFGDSVRLEVKPAD
ncbi:GIN domain-containing protein [Yoonia sp. 208BN28-4]|uniref:GIN domain-containing protein n=1 Tax=Yoonia sp. 208BN28-4 TaxID=3126505 RepID=UPI0030A84CE6